MNRDWMISASCRRVDDRIFYQRAPAAQDAAVTVCRTRCPVIAACRVYISAVEAHLHPDQIHGVAAGRTARQRRDAQRDVMGAAA